MKIRPARSRPAPAAEDSQPVDADRAADRRAAEPDEVDREAQLEDDGDGPGAHGAAPGALLDEHLAQQLPTFEQFFKTFGFKRVHGRIWGLLVLTATPLSAKDISTTLGLSQGATSTAVNELLEWGAITSEFDPARRCHLHAPVSNTLSIVATVIRRREQVAFQHFRVAAARTLGYVSERYGERDPRVLTLRSIISTCEIAEAVMQLVVSAVANALDDSESILHKAVSSALRVGLAVPSRLVGGRALPDAPELAAGPQAAPRDEERGGG